MNGEMTIIRTDGSVTSVPYSKKVPYDHLSKAVGGYIESVPRFTRYEGKDCVALCNEEGKMLGLAPNLTADRLWKEQLGVMIDDHLVGDIIILRGDAAFMRRAL